MMRDRQQSGAARSGLAAVELGLLLPVLMMLLIGVWEIARVAQVKEILMNAAREGSRQAASGRLTNSQVQLIVSRYVQNNGLPTANLVTSVSNLTSSGTDASNASQFDQIRVQAALPFGDVRLVALDFMNNASTLIAAESTWYSLKDKPYPDPDDPPIE